MGFRKDLTGRTFSQLTVIEYSHSQRQNEGKVKSTRIYYKCRCTCGNTITVLGGNLSKGNTKSCGCGRLETYEGITGSYFGQVMQGAKKRNLSFEITQHYIWELFLKQNSRCALTGWEITLPKFKIKGTASLDRIDSSKGYVVGNVQWLHKDVNVAKQDLSDQRFIELCVAVSNKAGEKLGF